MVMPLQNRRYHRTLGLGVCRQIVSVKVLAHYLTAPENIDQEDTDLYEILLISYRPRISLRDDCDTVCDSDVDGIVEIDRRLFSFD